MTTSPLFGRLPRTRLASDTTALLMVDVQRYFVHPEYPFGQQVLQAIPEGAKAYFRRVHELVLPNSQRLLKACRERGVFVVFTEFGSLHPGGLDMPGWARRHNERGHATIGKAVYPPFSDQSCRVDDSVAPRSGELILQKNTSGPLNSSRLDQSLRTLNIDTVIVAGLVTDVCVTQTAREFGDRNFDAIVVEDACATVNEARHIAALESLATSFGSVASTDQILGMLCGQ